MQPTMIQQQRDGGKVIETSTFFSDQTQDWIEKAASIVATTNDDDYRRFYEAPANADDSHNEASSSSESEDETVKQINREVSDELNISRPELISESTVSHSTSTELLKRQKKGKKSRKEQIQEQKTESQIQKAFDSIPCVQLPMPNMECVVLELATCLLPPKQSSTHPAHAYQTLVQQHRPSSTIVILTARSGRFAGAVYRQQQCVVHTTSNRYTVRRGQGKAQGAQDSGNGRPKSMGAQLRRHGEIQLQNDIAKALKEWEEYLAAASLILVSIPKTMIKSVLGEELSADERIRRVPLDIGRPSFESVSWIHTILMRSLLRQIDPEKEADSPKDLNGSEEIQLEKEETVLEVEIEEPSNAQPSFPELTPLHLAVAAADVNAIEELSRESEFDPNMVAGPDLMTALHYAAMDAPASVIQALLEIAQADPAVVDNRGRVPYYLAETVAARDAFRRARASLGEDRWDWSAAKVGPALTDTEAQQKQERLAEKRRLKRKKQKERKAMEQATEVAAQKAAEEALAAKKEEEEAKRIRDGLAEKRAGACDFCQTVCKGRQRVNMFQRLGYKYCSTECVQKHKRELMASAAAARFGG